MGSESSLCALRPTVSSLAAALRLVFLLFLSFGFFADFGEVEAGVGAVVFEGEAVAGPGGFDFVGERSAAIGFPLVHNGDLIGVLSTGLNTDELVSRIALFGSVA